MTIDVKHFEDCKQLFLTVGKCFAVEALMTFFGMEVKESLITKKKASIPHFGCWKQQKAIL